MKLQLLTSKANRFFSSYSKSIALPIAAKGSKGHVEQRFGLSNNFDYQRFMERQRQIVNETARLMSQTNSRLMNSFTEAHQSSTNYELFFHPADPEGTLVASIFNFLGLAYKPV